MSDMIKLTGLWKQEGKAGSSYLSGLVSPTTRLLIMPNTYKKSGKEPDYIAFFAPGKEASGSEEKPESKASQDPFDF